MLLTCLVSPVAGFVCSTLPATTDLVPTVIVIKYQIRCRMCTRACVCGVRAEVYHGTCHSRKLSSFYASLLTVLRALLVFWGIQGREKRAQRPLLVKWMGLSPTSRTSVLAPGKCCSPPCPRRDQSSRSKSCFSTGEAAFLVAGETEEA